MEFRAAHTHPKNTQVPLPPGSHSPVSSVYRKNSHNLACSQANFLETLNHCHSSVKFIIEMESNGMLPFLGKQLLQKSTHVERKDSLKPQNTGLLLHYSTTRVMSTIDINAIFQRICLIAHFDFLLSRPISLRNVITSNRCFLD